jgi:hypothetical protein
MPQETPQREDVFVSASSGTQIRVEFDPDRERLNLAKWVLLGLFLLSLVTFYVYVYQASEQSKALFDFYKVAVPPIVRLILGAYFKNGRD